jgi:small GTP-binding protein
MIRLWDAESGRIVRELKGHEGSIYGMAISPDGRRLATGGAEENIRIWNMEDGKMVAKLEGHEEEVNSVGWSGDGELIVSGGGDNLVKIWSARDGREITTLEGHTKSVVGVNFCGYGKLVATLCFDDTVRLWRRDTWGGIVVLRLGGVGFHGLSFAPEKPLLAAADREGGKMMIRIWRLDYERLVGGRPTVETLKYQNAKAVLLGDTGVGKTGLALALTGKGFKATESTHGRHVWTFEKSRDKKAKVEREIMLWDMAGQPGYRLVHQLHLQEVSAAMVLVDSRSETDPMRGVEYWARVLRQERSAIPLKKFLVEARIDVGRLAISRGELETFAKRHGFERVFATSAKDGRGIAELHGALADAVDWGELPLISSDKLFKTIKEWLTEKKKKARTRYIYTIDGLYREFHKKRYQGQDVRAEFGACVKSLAAAGMVEILEFDTLKEEARGSDKVLLKAESIDAYASVIIEAARQEPTEIGHLRETDVLQCKRPDGKELVIPKGDKLKDDE